MRIPERHMRCHQTPSVIRWFGFRVLVALIVLAVQPGSIVHAQEVTRTLSGSVALDIGVARQNYSVEVTVNNHSFVVLPPAFTILRPITSKASQRVVVLAGSNTVEFLISGILDDPVDYSVRIDCVNCSQTIPTQFYSPSGNRFGLANSTYIDPDDLISPLNLTAITRGSISGVIQLAGGSAAERDLRYSISVVGATNPALVYTTLAGLVIEAGEGSVAYAVNGLNRQIANQGYRVRLTCENCFGGSARPVSFASVLSPFEDHSGIDFTVTDDDPFPVAPIIDLILNSD